MEELNKEHIRIRYNGPAIKDHYINVSDLGSSLISLGNLCEIANKQANGNEILTKAMVSANFDQKCFELGFYLSIYAHIKTLMVNEDVATAKAIFEWLGILASSSKKISGLFKTAAKIGGNEITNKEKTTIDNSQCIKIKVKGDNNLIYVTGPTMTLLEDPNAKQNLQNFVKPIAKQDYDNLEFESQKGSNIITHKDANKILEYGNQTGIEETQTIKTWLQIYSPVYKEDAKTWKFLYDGSSIFVDISETDIAQQVMKRGGTQVGDRYHVNLEIRQKTTSTGSVSPHYKILKVFKFREGPIQQTIE